LKIQPTSTVVAAEAHQLLSQRWLWSCTNTCFWAGTVLPVLLLAPLLAMPGMASAQSAPVAPPRLEIAPGVGGLIFPVDGAFQGITLNALATVNLTPRLAIEAGGDIGGFSYFHGLYLLQGRWVMKRRSGGGAVFLTAGIGGTIELEKQEASQVRELDGSTLSFPAGTYGRLGTPLGAAGIGFTVPVGHRNAFRCDVQTSLGVDHDFLAIIRVAASYSIAIGRAPESP
jgi:hypothetical protein